MAKKKMKHRIMLWILGGVTGMVLLLFYGPFPQFRLLWINTAMYSSHFKFLATAFYSQAYIRKVLDIPFPREQTNPELLQEFSGDVILFAELKGDYYRGYIIKIDNPRRLFLVPSGEEQGMLLEDLCAARQGLGAINGAGYRNDKKRGLPWGTVIVEGNRVSTCAGHTEHTIGGLTKAYKLVVGRMTDHEILEWDFEWAFEFGPLLIINGEKTTLNTYSGGLAPRTAIGQTKEGHILLMVIDGRQVSSIGATYRDVQTILYENGAINAIGLDGGASSCMVYEGKLVSSPSEGDRGRLLPNALVFK
jgi:exopolysaccharide biosynthesis protein